MTLPLRTHKPRRFNSFHAYASLIVGVLSQFSSIIHLTTGIGCPEKMSVRRSTWVSITSICAISSHE